MKTSSYLYTITFFICEGCIAVRHQNAHEHNKNKWNFVFFVQKNRGFARFKRRLIRSTLDFLKAFRFVSFVLLCLSFRSHLCLKPSDFTLQRGAPQSQLSRKVGLSKTRFTCFCNSAHFETQITHCVPYQFPHHKGGSFDS